MTTEYGSGSLVEGSSGLSNYSSQNELMSPRTPNGDSVSMHYTMVSKKFECALCSGCKPTKRNNVEQHVWQKHPKEHGGDSFLQKYRASEHKHLVARFVVPVQDEYYAPYIPSASAVNNEAQEAKRRATVASCTIQE